MRDAGDDSGAPMVNDLFGLIAKHFAGESQIALVFLRKSRADFKLLQFPHR
jgi:hypothetical protein